MTFRIAFLITATIVSSEAFLSPKAPACLSSTEMKFGIPSFGGDSRKENEKEAKEEKKVGLSGLFQLVAAGMGAPFLGDFEGVDEESGKFMFSLEANNLVDEKGNSKQTQMPYFENGWVDEEELKRQEERKASGGFKFPWDK